MNSGKAGECLILNRIAVLSLNEFLLLLIIYNFNIIAFSQPFTNSLLAETKLTSISDVNNISNI